MENALLRERINDIAAEVAKLAMQLEGPNSPIEALLAAEPAIPPKPANGARRQWQRCPKVAERWPSASAPCSPTPPAPASKGREDFSRNDFTAAARLNVIPRACGGSSKP